MAMTFSNIQKRFKEAEDVISKYKRSDVYDDDMFRRYQKLLKNGEIEKAVQFWNSSTPRELMYMWGQTIDDVINWAVSDEVKNAQLNIVTSKLNFISRKASEIICNSHKSFTTDIIAKHYFDVYKISEPELKNKIISAAIEQFNYYVDGAMSNTTSSVLTDIRMFQKELHFHYAEIGRMDNLDEYLEQVQKQFKDRMKKRFPNLYRSMEEGKVLKSRFYGKDLDKVKAYTLEEYTEMMTRPTILNIDRAAALANAHQQGLRVVEYVIRDHRPLATEGREICQRILRKKIHGKSLLALDEETSVILKIMTVEQAKEQGAMYIHCRHGIVPVSKEFNDELEKVIFLENQISAKSA